MVPYLENTTITIIYCFGIFILSNSKRRSKQNLDFPIFVSTEITHMTLISFHKPSFLAIRWKNYGIMKTAFGCQVNGMHYCIYVLLAKQLKPKTSLRACIRWLLGRWGNWLITNKKIKCRTKSIIMKTCHHLNVAYSSNTRLSTLLSLMAGH